MLTRRIKIQLAVFTAIALLASAIMVFSYINVPALLNFGRYTVTVELPRAAGLYNTANVTYRGTEVGRVTDLKVTDKGVDAVLSLRSRYAIPANLEAQVHSVSAIGEQYIALLPRTGDGPTLRNGDVIALKNSTVPPEINNLLDAANRGLTAIPRDNMKTLIDEAYAGVGGLGTELSRIVRGSTKLSIDARKNLDPILSLIDQSGAITESQARSAPAIRAWAAHLADLTNQFATQDPAVSGLLAQGSQAAEEGRKLVERLQPTLPVLMANLKSIGQLAVAYNASIEQLLVFEPQIVSLMGATLVANRFNKSPHAGIFVDFNLNLNFPPPCLTGYLPPQQWHSPAVIETVDLPEGNLYCRIPQDSYNVVRGARNYPCMTRPGKRAPTAKMCESDEEYVPLNDGWNWKGDPNATLSGQDVPQLPPGSPSAFAPPPAAANGQPPAPSPGGKTWQNMLTPAG